MRPTNLAQLHHTGGGEVSLLAALQPPVPPLLLALGQHQDDVTQRQLQLVGPVWPVAVHYYHLVVRGRVTEPQLIFFLFIFTVNCDFVVNLNEVQLFFFVVLITKHKSVCVCVFSAVSRLDAVIGEDYVSRFKD